MAAPKKRPKKNEDEKDEVEPKSPNEELKDKMAELLSAASLARTQSVKLHDVEYAGNLCNELVEYAESLEEFFKKVQKALEQKPGDSLLVSLKRKAESKLEAGEKAKAGFFYDAHLMNYDVDNFEVSTHFVNVIHRHPAPCAQSAANAFLCKKKPKGKAKAKAKAKGKAKEEEAPKS